MYAIALVPSGLALQTIWTRKHFEFACSIQLKFQKNLDFPSHFSEFLIFCLFFDTRIYPIATQTNSHVGPDIPKHCKELEAMGSDT